MKDKLKYLWIATTVSFLLSIQYIERYTDEKNRMLFFWNRWDGLAIIFSAFLVGSAFYFVYLLANKFRNRHILKIVESSFILIFGIAIIKDIEWWLVDKSSNYNQGLRLILEYFIYFLYGALFCALCTHLFRKSKKIRNAFIRLCLILSPIIPVFLITSFGYKTWAIAQGTLPNLYHMDAKNIDRPHTFIFFFDEWSYKRSYNHKELLPLFKNLNRFKESSVSFHKAYSPYQGTFQTLPRFIFQNSHNFGIKNNRLFFEEGEKKIAVDEMESIFLTPHKEGYFTVLVGCYFPYINMVGDDVDFVRSFSDYKIKGESFLAVTYYHILKSLGLYSFHFSPQAVTWLEEASSNQYQLRTTSTIHKQALSIIKNVNNPTFALFHYPIPHEPFVYNRYGAKDVFQIYGWTVDNYVDNLSYLDNLIREIIATLQESDKYENSLLVLTSDHSWRDDPDAPKDRTQPEHRHVPLFIKFPNQKKGYESDVELNLSGLFEFIKQYPMLKSDVVIVEEENGVDRDR